MITFEDKNIQGKKCSDFVFPERRAYFDNEKNYDKAISLLNVIVEL